MCVGLGGCLLYEGIIRAPIHIHGHLLMVVEMIAIQVDVRSIVKVLNCRVEETCESDKYQKDRFDMCTVH
jgi:hypothetical protein